MDGIAPSVSSRSNIETAFFWLLVPTPRLSLDQKSKLAVVVGRLVAVVVIVNSVSEACEDQSPVVTVVV